MQFHSPVDEYSTLYKIYKAVTTDKPGQKIQLPDDTIVKVQAFKSKGLRYINYKGLTYIEQNKNTGSAYAKRAKEGAKIMWVIRQKGGTYLGRIEDGRIFTPTIEQKTGIEA